MFPLVALVHYFSRNKFLGPTISSRTGLFRLSKHSAQEGNWSSSGTQQNGAGIATHAMQHVHFHLTKRTTAIPSFPFRCPAVMHV